jgi:hypothetical protein
MRVMMVMPETVPQNVHASTVRLPGKDVKPHHVRPATFKSLQKLPSGAKRCDPNHPVYRKGCIPS